MPGDDREFVAAEVPTALPISLKMRVVIRVERLDGLVELKPIGNWPDQSRRDQHARQNNQPKSNERLDEKTEQWCQKAESRRGFELWQTRFHGISDHSGVVDVLCESRRQSEVHAESMVSQNRLGVRIVAASFTDQESQVVQSSTFVPASKRRQPKAAVCGPGCGCRITHRSRLLEIRKPIDRYRQLPGHRREHSGGRGILFGGRSPDGFPATAVSHSCCGLQNFWRDDWLRRDDRARRDADFSWDGHLRARLGICVSPEAQREGSATRGSCGRGGPSAAALHQPCDD